MLKYYTQENDRIVRDAFSRGDSINGWMIADYSPHKLRYVLRRGKMVLQQELLVKVTYAEKIWKYGGFVREDRACVWFDIPIDDGKESP